MFLEEPDRGSEAENLDASPDVCMAPVQYTPGVRHGGQSSPKGGHASSPSLAAVLALAGGSLWLVRGPGGRRSWVTGGPRPGGCGSGSRAAVLAL